jgi:mannose/fructose/N-acetylgalactosamine-specific phosphotransferase system component IIC
MNNATGTFQSIITISNLLTQNAIAIGTALAVLVFVVRTVMILFTTTNTPAGRSERWEGIRIAFIVAILIGAALPVIRLAEAIGGMVK